MQEVKQPMSTLINAQHAIEDVKVEGFCGSGYSSGGTTCGSGYSSGGTSSAPEELDILV